MQPAPARPGIALLLPLRPGQRPRRVGGEPQERGRGPARTDPEVGATPGTGRDRQGGHERPQPGPRPARGGVPAVSVESLIPGLPVSRAEPLRHSEAHLLVPQWEWEFKFLFGFLLPARKEKTSCCGLTETPVGAAAAGPLERTGLCSFALCRLECAPSKSDYASSE